MKEVVIVKNLLSLKEKLAEGVQKDIKYICQDDPIHELNDFLKFFQNYSNRKIGNDILL